MEPSDKHIIVDIAILVCQAVRLLHSSTKLNRITLLNSIQLALQRSQGTLSSVSRVSKSWNSAARPELYRSLVFDLRPRHVYRSKRILASLHPASNNCHFVQEIEVTDIEDILRKGAPSSHRDQFINLISDVLSRCNNLKVFECVGLSPLLWT